MGEQTVVERDVCNKCLTYMMPCSYSSFLRVTYCFQMLPPGTAELLNRVNGCQTRQKYPPALRTFALTLNFYSSKAYNYVRRNFHTSLPHPRTLRRWYGVVDGNPGFSKEAAVALRMKSQEFLNNGKKLLCAMSFDEIAIRKHIEFRDNKFVGYVDYGAELDHDNLPVANEALTFMVTAVNGNWKLPIGYFLVNGLTALEKCNLLTEALKFTFDVGVEVISVTFDGTHVNTAMIEKLGASLSVANMKPSFKHPLSNDEVCIFLDPCHMLKLVRNTLAGKGTIFDGHKNPIKWEYILKLHDLQREEALHLATKIRMKHIEWYRHKMNVRIAAQTLSNSVANAIEFLNKDLQLEDFKGSEATVRFLRYMNNAFDCFNSRNLLAKGYKAPLSLQTANHILSLLEETETYIKELRLDANGPSVLYTNRKTGFLGFIVSIQSLKRLYDSLISSPSPKLKFLLTHKLLQDHVETFFSSIRRYGGDNNNPTATQFKAAYKRLLIHQQVKGSEFGTCLDSEECSILNVSSGLGMEQTNPFVSSLNFHSEITGVETVTHDHCYDIPVTCFEQLSKYVTNVVVYISGFIVRKLLKTIYCAECANSLSGTLESGSELLTRKNMGGLVTPSRDVVKLCKIGEQAYRLQQAKGMLMKKNVMLVLLSCAMAEIDSSIFTSIGEHIMNIEPAENHRTTLIKSILFEYFKIRNHHLGKIATEDFQAGSVRSLFTKTILFKGH